MRYPFRESVRIVIVDFVSVVNCSFRLDRIKRFRNVRKNCIKNRLLKGGVGWGLGGGAGELRFKKRRWIIGLWVALGVCVWFWCGAAETMGFC